jgi:predicted enzyme related to lactoylglutathione lyase
MALTAEIVTIDCADPRTLAEFWSAAAGMTALTDLGDPYVMLKGESGILLALQKVVEPKVGKNRVHIDFRSTDRRADVERLVGLGASVVEEHRTGGFAWTVLSDPEDNVFCVGAQV